MLPTSSDPVTLADVRALVLLRRQFAARGLRLCVQRSAPFIGDFTAEAWRGGVECLERFYAPTLPLLLLALEDSIDPACPWGLASRFPVVSSVVNP